MLPSQSSQSPMHVIIQCEYSPGHRGQIALCTGAPDHPNLRGLVLTKEHPPPHTPFFASSDLLVLRPKQGFSWSWPSPLPLCT